MLWPSFLILGLTLRTALLQNCSDDRKAKPRCLYFCSLNRREKLRFSDVILFMGQ